MSNSPHDKNKPKDDDLLADAIPIDPADLEDDSDTADRIDVLGNTDVLPSIDVAPESQEKARDTQIRFFDEKKRHEDKWNRSPNTTGKGAIHVKTFFTKLRPDAIEYLDQQINEWLDAHPQYEVKFATTTIGEMMSKVKEPTMMVNVWV